MSTIHVQTLVGVLDKRPFTLVELAEATGYSIRLVLQFIWEARRDGHHIQAVPGLSKGEPTTYELRDA